MNNYVKGMKGNILLRRDLSISDVIRWVHVASCIYLGYAKFRSPRWSVSGLGGEGLSGHCATSPRAQEVADESECSSSDTRRTFTGWLGTIFFPLNHIFHFCCRLERMYRSKVDPDFESAPLEVFPTHATAQKTAWRTYYNTEWQRYGVSHPWHFTFLSGSIAGVALKVWSCRESSRWPAGHEIWTAARSQAVL